MGFIAAPITDVSEKKGGINATGIVTNANQFTTTNTTYTDVTGFTVSITTTKTCTILAWCRAHVENGTVDENSRMQLVIDGTNSGEAINARRTTNSLQGVMMEIFGRKTGVAAGTITVKGQVRSGNTGTTTFYGPDVQASAGNGIMVIAIVE